MALSRTTLLAILTLACGVVGAFALSRPPVQVMQPAAAARPAAARGGWLDPALAGITLRPQETGRQAFTAAGMESVYGRNGRAIDFGGLDAAQYIAARIGAARTGDMRAAYEVFQAASACAAVDEPLPEFADDNDRSAVQQERQHTRKLCANVSPVQMQERMSFLAKAADSGNRAAQIDFFMEGPGGKPTDIAANPDDPQVQQWKMDAMRYLQQAGNECDHFALSLLANAYDAGQLVPHDGRMTLAYSMAAAAARKKAMTPEQLRSRFGDELSEADFATAVQMGARLTQQACPAS